eukprot:COSAG01_NODE_4065_length_5387_cov_1.992436_1_plen_114_part_00
MRDLNSIRDSRPFRRLFRFPHVNGVEDLRGEVSQLRGGTGAYTQRALWQGVVQNPVAATVHFHRRVMIMNRVLLGISVSSRILQPYSCTGSSTHTVATCNTVPVRYTTGTYYY